MNHLSLVNEFQGHLKLNQQGKNIILLKASIFYLLFPDMHMIMTRSISDSLQSSITRNDHLPRILIIYNIKDVYTSSLIWVNLFRQIYLLSKKQITTNCWDFEDVYTSSLPFQTNISTFIKIVEISSLSHILSFPLFQ